MKMSQENKSSVFKVWTIILNSILIIFVLIGVAIAFSLLPLKNNYRILAVMSGSMEPTISTGALILIKPVSNYQEKDIITFKTPNSIKTNDFTTHRIEKIETKNEQKFYITKGDANSVSDSEQISQGDIVGKELFSIELLGYVLGYIKTLPGLLILIIIPAVIIVYEELNKIKAEASRIFNEKKLKKAKNESNSKKI